MALEHHYASRHWVQGGLDGIQRRILTKLEFVKLQGPDGSDKTEVARAGIGLDLVCAADHGVRVRAVVMIELLVDVRE